MDHIDAQTHLGNPAEFGVPNGGLTATMQKLQRREYSPQMDWKDAEDANLIYRHFIDLAARIRQLMHNEENHNKMAAGIMDGMIYRNLIETGELPSNYNIHKVIDRMNRKIAYLEAGGDPATYKLRNRQTHEDEPATMKEMTLDLCVGVLARHLDEQIAPHAVAIVTRNVVMTSEVQALVDLARALLAVFPGAGK